MPYHKGAGGFPPAPVRSFPLGFILRYIDAVAVTYTHLDVYKRQVLRNTGVTLAMCAIMGLVICVIDFGLGKLIQLLVSLG